MDNYNLLLNIFSTDSTPASCNTISEALSVEKRDYIKSLSNQRLLMKEINRFAAVIITTNDESAFLQLYSMDQHLI